MQQLTIASLKQSEIASLLFFSNAVALLLSFINESNQVAVQYYRLIINFSLISQGQDFTYSIPAKALTHSLSRASVLQQMRDQTLQHLSTLRLESELERGCFLLLKPFPKQLKK